MACENNVYKGKDLVFLARNDADTAWEIVGGVKTRGRTTDNPVEDVTSSSTTTDYSEAEYTGFSTSTFNVSGVADSRTGITDPVTGLNIVGEERLDQIAHTGNRCGKFRMINVRTNRFVEGYYTVTSYSTSGDTPGLLGFDATLQSKSDIVVGP